MSIIKRLQDSLKPFIVAAVKNQFKITAVGLAVSGLVSLFSWDLYWAWRIEKNRIPNIVARLESGYTGDAELEKVYFERPDEERKINSILDEPALGGFFYLVTGPHGTGKSSIMKHCSRQKKGVSYFQVPDNHSEFCNELVKAINYDMTPADAYRQFLSRFRIQITEPQSSTLEMTLNALSEASISYKKKHSRSPVLIIDQLTTLAKEDQRVFRRLIQFAKTEADEKRLVLVFVASEGNTPRQLAKFSEKSRRGSVIEIGDLDDVDAARFLDSYIENPASVVNITGGRMIYLLQAIDMLQKKQVQSSEELRTRFIDEVANEFVDSKLVFRKDIHQLDQRKKTWIQLKKIYDSPLKSVAYREFIEDVGEDDADYLLSKNIFSYQHNSSQVTFQSKPVGLYVGGVIGERGTETRKELENILQCSE